MLYRINRQSHMLGDLLIGPVSAGKHGNGKLQRCQQICYIPVHLGIVDLHPATAECNDPIHQFFINFRFAFSQTDLQNALQ